MKASRPNPMTIKNRFWIEETVKRGSITRSRFRCSFRTKEEAEHRCLVLTLDKGRYGKEFTVRSAPVIHQ